MMLYFAGAFLLGVYVALLAAYIGSGATNGAAGVLLGGWGALWLVGLGAGIARRHEGDEYQDDAPPAPPRRYLRPPVQHVLTIRHEGHPADLATERWEVQP